MHDHFFNHFSVRLLFFFAGMHGAIKAEIGSLVGQELRKITSMGGPPISKWWSWGVRYV